MFYNKLCFQSKGSEYGKAECIQPQLSRFWNFIRDSAEILRGPMPHSLKVTLGRFRSRVEQRAPEEGKATARGFTKTSSWKAAKDGQRSSNGTLGLCPSVQDTPVREGGTAPLPLNTVGLGWRVGSVWGCSLISSFIQQTFTDSLLGPALAQQKKDPSFEVCTGAVSIMEKGLGCRHVSPNAAIL